MILLFLVVLFALFVLECILTETENFGWATVTLVLCGVASAALGHWLHIYSVLDFIRDHGVWTLAYVGVYVCVGVVWSFAKWFSFLMGFRDSFRSLKEGFLKSRDMDPNGQVPDNLRSAFKDYIRQNAGWNNQYKHQLWEMERPRASKNKARITAWSAFWPFSFVGTLLNDPVRRLFNFLFNQFKALYQKMADHVFRKDVELQ